MRWPSRLTRDEKQPEGGLQRAERFIHHLPWEHHYDVEMKEIAAITPRPVFLPVLRLLEGVVEYEEATGTLVTRRWQQRNRRASDYPQDYSVTGRQIRPVMLFQKRTSLLCLWIGVGIFYPQSDSTSDIEEANISTDKDGFGYLISECVFT
jgi:hypothetical protein